MTLDLKQYGLDTSVGLANAIKFTLENKKARDVEIIDLEGKTGVADFFVVASATSTTAVKALGDYVEEQLDRNGVKATHLDVDGKWIAMDYNNVIVHIFYDETRKFYDLERLWK